MPLPLLFIGIAAATGGVGLGKGIKAGMDTVKAGTINKEANAQIKAATDKMNKQRNACGKALRVLGEEKLFVLNNSISSFLQSFQQIKNVDFTESEGLEELQIQHKTALDLEVTPSAEPNMLIYEIGIAPYLVVRVQHCHKIVLILI